MKIRNKNIVLLVLFFICYFSVVSLFADEKEEVFIEELPSFSTGNEKGYDVFNFRLENLTSNKKTIDIRVYINNGSYPDIEVTKQVELVGRESRNEKVFFPVRTYSYKGEAYFYINGREIEHLRLKNKHGSYNSSKSILLDKSITVNDTDKLFKDQGLDWTYRDSYNLCYFESNLDMMDKDWIAYYQYVALMFRDKTYKEMPQAVREAIMDYVKAGGCLIIFGEIEVPTGFWTVRKDNAKSYTSCVRCSYNIGLGRLLLCDKYLFDLIKKTPKSSSGYSSYSRKENKSTEVTDKISGKYIPSDILHDFGINRQIRQNDLKVENCFNDEYKAMTSVGLLIVLVFIFALLIGPVNFYFLNVYKKRILIFVSVPLISLVCCSVIFIYFLLFEYGRLDIFRQSFVLLDENSNTSVVLGGELIISGKSLNEPLSFPINSVIGFNNGSYRRESGSGVKGIKLDKTQNFVYNWIKAKEPFTYSLVSMKQDRSRVEFNKSGSDYEILNGLGADISVIYYREADNRVYRGANIRAGSKATITKTSNNYRMTSNAIDLYSMFKNYDKPADSAESFVKNLRPGEYLAVLKSDPFLKQDLDKKGHVREMGCFVYGVSKKGVTR